MVAHNTSPSWSHHSANHLGQIQEWLEEPEVWERFSEGAAAHLKRIKLQHTDGLFNRAVLVRLDQYYEWVDVSGKRNQVDMWAIVGDRIEFDFEAFGKVDEFNYANQQLGNLIKRALGAKSLKNALDARK